MTAARFIATGIFLLKAKGALECSASMAMAICLTVVLDPLV